MSGFLDFQINGKPWFECDRETIDAAFMGLVNLTNEAAALRSRIAELEKALKPFVEHFEQGDAELCKAMELCGLATSEDKVDVTHPAVRRARAVLSQDASLFALNPTQHFKGQANEVTPVSDSDIEEYCLSRGDVK